MLQELSNILFHCIYFSRDHTAYRILKDFAILFEQNLLSWFTEFPKNLKDFFQKYYTVLLDTTYSFYVTRNIFKQMSLFVLRQSRVINNWQ